ncbi:hypothetical protein [Kingella potus]|nr:hypothetical protein [Kingella potus]
MAQPRTRSLPSDNFQTAFYTTQTACVASGDTPYTAQENGQAV